MIVMLFLLTTLGGILLFFITVHVVTAPGRRLANRFARLGTITGKAYAQIREIAGPECSLSRQITADGRTIILRRWLATGYQIDLLFDSADRCIAVISEAAF